MTDPQELQNLQEENGPKLDATPDGWCISLISIASA
jgi:hypothetical protein